MTARSTRCWPALLAGGLARNQIRIPDGAGIVHFAAPFAFCDLMAQIRQWNTRPETLNQSWYCPERPQR